jgi:steroid delta-isomerase-like uncharacterized protein
MGEASHVDSALWREEDRPTMTSTKAVRATGLDPTFLEDFSHRWLEAWNHRDGDGLSQLCTHDVEFTDPAIGTIRGRAAVADWVRICQRAFPDYRFEEPEPAYASRHDYKAIAPWRMVGTHTGPLSPPGFAPTGRSVVIDGVDHWWFRDGLVARYRADYDLTGVSRQLGLVPERGSRAEQLMVRLQRLQQRLARRRRR